MSRRLISSVQGPVAAATKAKSIPTASIATRRKADEADGAKKIANRWSGGGDGDGVCWSWQSRRVTTWLMVVVVVSSAKIYSSSCTVHAFLSFSTSINQSIIYSLCLLRVRVIFVRVEIRKIQKEGSWVTMFANFVLIDYEFKYNIIPFFLVIFSIGFS